MKKLTASILSAMLMLSMVFSSSVFAANDATQASAWDSFVGLFTKATTTADTVGVQYKAHIQNKGTMTNYVTGPTEMGTRGESLRMEGFWIKLTNAPADLKIKYDVQIENEGWLKNPDDVSTWFTDDQFAGSQEKSQRIETIKLVLVDSTGAVSKDYSVQYKGHVQNIGNVPENDTKYTGTTGWYADGEQLGTVGSSLRLEALQVQIVQKASDLTAYNAAKAAVTQADYTAASWTTYQAVVTANPAATTDLQSKVDAATAAILDAQADLVTKAVVTSATAATQNTITLQGAALNKLAVADITVQNITVSSVAANADGTSATVTLASDLLADTATPVAIKSDGDTSNFTVKFTIATQKLAVVGGLFDKTLTNQKLKLTLDGVPVTTDYLAANGYAVTFYAYTPANVAATTLLDNGSSVGAATNSNGLILVPGTDASYLVQATAVKGSTILSSEKVSVQVLDLINTGSAIQSYKMTQSAGAKTMNSTTLSVNDPTATTITDVVVQYSSTNTVKLDTVTGGYVLNTSDKNIVKVSGYTIQAVAPGTATITIQAGSLTKTITVTSTQAVRVPTTVKANTAQVNAVVDNTGVIASATNTITALDQFGDPCVGIAAKFVTAAPADYTEIKYAVTGSISGLTSGTTAIAPAAAAADAAAGKYTVTMNSGVSVPTDGTISTIAFTNKAGASVGSFTVKAVTNNFAKKTLIEYKTGSVNQSNVLNANMVDMGVIALVANEYNSSNVFVGNVADLDQYTILYDPNMVTITGRTALGVAVPADAASTATKFICDGTTAYVELTPVTNAKGTTPIKVYTTATLETEVDSRTITVNAVAPKITAVTFKAVTAKVGDITYKDVLTYTERSGKDPIISGLTLSESTGYDVCLDVTDGKTIYIDRDRDGALTVGENIGEMTFTINNTNGITYAAGTNTVSIVAGANGSFTYTLWDTTPEPTTPKVVVNSGTVVVSN